MFEGLYTALVTPFTSEGLNLAVLKKLIIDLMGKGVDGFVPLGTTGESPTLTTTEREEVISTCVEAVAGKMPIIVGTGTNDTQTTIQRTQRAAELGAAGALVVCPYYNRPPQEGLYRHFLAVAEAAPIPLVLYNIPGRAAVNLLPETIERLSAHERIVAIKEASGNLDQSSEIMQRCGDNLTLLAGDDSLILPTLACGGRGAISAAANVVPQELKNIMKLFFSGRVGAATLAHLSLYPVLKTLFIETNPIAVKAALVLQGYEVGSVRLPLVPLQEKNHQLLHQTLRNYGFLTT